MTKYLFVGALVVATTLSGCSKREPAEATAGGRDEIAAEPQAPTGSAAFDVCKLLSNDEIAAVQGEAPASAQLLGESAGQLTVSQCNFLLPAGSNSLAVRVVERGKGPNARNPRDVWQETFHRPPPDAANARFTRQHQKVEGVGEEAFWLGNAKSGGLHVLTGDRYIRINVGGQEEVPAKIAKSSKLAQLILPRLRAQQ